MNDPRRLSPEQLGVALGEARRATLAASMDLDDSKWRVPVSPWIQPTAWDLAHVGWFAEFWMLRGPHRLGVDGCQDAAGPARLFGPDEHYDSARIAHADRWRIPLLSREQLAQRLADQLGACVEALGAPTDDIVYFAHLALFHELMHVEALAWTRAQLGYAPPRGLAMPPVPAATAVAVAGGEATVGADAASGFAFDNETPPARRRLGAFAIDSHPVRNDAFAAFVEDAGYERADLWPDAAGRWLAAAGRRLPERWRRDPRGAFEHRHYDRWLPLPPDEPVVHVNAFEAEAYCRWAGRRLPTAAEWEVAAARDDVHWGGTVWEWTRDAFAPYPGFRPGPYTTYSAPWFHHQRELRGCAYATHAWLRDRRYRNFFLPHRSDVFAGFRTAADG